MIGIVVALGLADHAPVRVSIGQQDRPIGIQARQLRHPVGARSLAKERPSGKRQHLDRLGSQDAALRVDLSYTVRASGDTRSDSFVRSLP